MTQDLHSIRTAHVRLVQDAYGMDAAAAEDDAFGAALAAALEQERAKAYETIASFAAANDEGETQRYAQSVAAAIRRRHERDDA